MKKMSITELRHEIDGLSHADFRKLKFADNNEAIEKFVGIWNTDKGILESIQSKHYRIVQHAEAFTPIVDVIENTGISKNFYGRIQEYKGRAYMKLAFPELKFTPADGREVFLGFVARNSYNGTTGVWVGGFGMRICCENQMVLKNLIEGKSIKHIGNTEIAQEIGGFVLEVGERIPIIQSVIDKAITDTMTIEEAAKELAERKVCERRAKVLISKFSDGDQTRWGLYNVITDYASHEVDRPSIENRLLEVAEGILTARAGDKK